MLSGKAMVIDGDTLEIAGARVRLFGIDAPEASQQCTRAGADWACGRWATEELIAIIAGASVVCEGRDRDRYGRLVAVCRAEGVDIADSMVRAGAAQAYRRYALDYVGAEKEAMFAARGIWAGQMEAPASVRAAARGLSAEAGPDGCRIKGNISA